MRYKNRAIGSTESLAKALSLTKIQLVKYANIAERYYIERPPEVKPDGSLRKTYDTQPMLKKIHGRILTEILHKVEYPIYLQGSIKDIHQPRDYISNCSIHSKKRIVISEDICNFFDSIRSDHVFRMWKYNFNFPDEVAKLLTKLTTYKGRVPQGARTSSYIANLIFWNLEPLVVEKLKERGIEYSRYVDDITISSHSFMPPKVKTFVIDLIYGMLLNKDVKPNRKKHKVSSSSDQMTVHKLNVNSKKPTISKRERKNIRAMVRLCELMSRTEQRNNKNFIKLFNSTEGKVKMLMRLHKNTGTKLLQRLNAIQP